MWQGVIELAVELVRDCGVQLRRVPEATPKCKTDLRGLVMEYGRSVEERIRYALKVKFPTHSFLRGESVRECGGRLWVLDPIDGITDLVSWYRDSTVLLAYYYKQQPVFGIVYNVMRDELFLGVHGKGAWRNRERMAQLRKEEVRGCILDTGLHVSDYMRKACGSDPLTTQNEFRAHRYLGCASLNIVRTAQGLSDLYLSAHIKCWDYAAATIILEGVQGVYSIQNTFLTTTDTLAMSANRRPLITMVEKECL